MICTCTARAAGPLRDSGGYVSWLLKHPTRRPTRGPIITTLPCDLEAHTCVGVKLAVRLRCVLHGPVTDNFEGSLSHAVQAVGGPDLSQRAGERRQERV